MEAFGRIVGKYSKIPNGKSSVTLISPDLCDPQRSSWIRSTQVWGEPLRCSFLLSTLLKARRFPFCSRSKYTLNCFDALKRPHPEKPGLSVPPLNPEQETVVGPPVIKHVYREGCQTTFVFVFCLFSTYIIINSLQVVYKHWYRLNNKLESSIDSPSVSVHCVSLQEAITFLKVADRLHQT